MIDLFLDEQTKIVVLRPKSAMSAGDIEGIAKKIDPFIEAHGDLAGLMIVAEDFPGWDSFSAMLTHLKFIKNHHHHVKKIAFVTNSRMLEFAPVITAHFVSAKIKSFDLSDEARAIDWILSA